MQQLLGDKTATFDKTFFRELLLQRLPPTVRMVLASTPDSTSLDELVQLADKVVEAIAPSVAAVNPPDDLSSQLQRLQSVVNSLKSLVQSLPQTTHQSRGHRRIPARTRSPSPHRSASDQTVGTTAALMRKLASAHHPALKLLTSQQPTAPPLRSPPTSSTSQTRTQVFIFSWTREQK